MHFHAILVRFQFVFFIFFLPLKGKQQLGGIVPLKSGCEVTQGHFTSNTIQHSSALKLHCYLKIVQCMTGCCSPYMVKTRIICDCYILFLVVPVSFPGLFFVPFYWKKILFIGSTKCEKENNLNCSS